MLVLVGRMHLLLTLGAALAAPSRTAPITIDITPVYELCLSGRSDGAAWTAALAPEGLAPALTDGQATLLLCATTLRFGGRTFHESVLSVAVAEPDGADGAFLVGAYNTVRFYAWVERRRNRSPYTFAHIALGSAASPALVVTTDQVVWSASLGPRPGGMALESDPFDGPIYLPSVDGRGGWFYAQLDGEAQITPYDPAVDGFSLGPPGADPLRDRLGEVGFEPLFWSLRPAARHAKSDTQDR